jgi:hypothetical protein
MTATEVPGNTSIKRDTFSLLSIINKDYSNSVRHDRQLRGWEITNTYSVLLFFSFVYSFEIKPYRQVSEENCAQFSPTAEIATGDGAIVAWMCGYEHAKKTSISANNQMLSPVVSFWPPRTPYVVKPPCLA